MNREQVQDKMQEIVSNHLGVDRGQITPETRFVEDLNADSLDAVELTMEVEDEFDLSISDDQVGKLTTFGTAVDHVYEQVKGRP